MMTVFFLYLLLVAIRGWAVKHAFSVDQNCTLMLIAHVT